MVEIKRINKIGKDQYSKLGVELSKKLFNDATLILKRASYNNDLNLYRRAIENYYKALEHYSNFVECYIALSYIAWKMNEHDNAIKLIKSALSIEPTNKNAINIFEAISLDLKNNKNSTVVSNYIKNKSVNKTSEITTQRTNLSQPRAIKNESQNSLRTVQENLNKMNQNKNNIKVFAGTNFLNKLNKI